MPDIIHTSERIQAAYIKLKIGSRQLLETADAYTRDYRKLDLLSALNNLVVHLAEDEGGVSLRTLAETRPLTLHAIATVNSGMMSQKVAKILTQEDASISYPIITSDLHDLSSEAFKAVGLISRLGDKGFAQAIALKVLLDVISHASPSDPQQQFLENRRMLDRVGRGLSEHPGFPVALNEFLEKYHL
jgi:hypothetical protein